MISWDALRCSFVDRVSPYEDGVSVGMEVGSGVSVGAGVLDGAVVAVGAVVEVGVAVYDDESSVAVGVSGRSGAAAGAQEQRQGEKGNKKFVDFHGLVVLAIVQVNGLVVACSSLRRSATDGGAIGCAKIARGRFEAFNAGASRSHPGGNPGIRAIAS